MMRTILCSAAVFGLVFAFGLRSGESRQNNSSVEHSESPVAVNDDEIGIMLRKWYSKGTAAGNMGDYYDNRDGGHSDLNMKPYPQLQRIEYTEEQIQARQNWGMQKRILPHVVFGNSSTSAPPDRGGSIARSYYTNPNGLGFLFTQYVRNNLYVYPEHRDHDPGHNGISGYGDLYPTNTPYLFIPQGSSGSDQAFISAMPYVLAAFRPEVKKRLVQTGMLMPTIQMILRITNKQLKKHEEYLTGKAHPSVFRGSDINVKKMVEMAQEIILSTLPPIALLKVLSEDTPANGIDYFEPEQTEILADTPAVIARIFRGSNHLRKMTVSAHGSGDPNKRPLSFFWTVLRGNPDRIQIEYLNQDHSIAEITIPYFHRSPIANGSELESNRIDIGVFVHNGIYYSPPAFLTFYTLDSEARTYEPDGRPLDIAYDVETSTISVADWEALFEALDPQAGSWPCRFLRRQFSAQEISGLDRISKDYRKIHAALIAARRKYEQEIAAAKAAGDAVKILESKHAAAEKLHDREQSKESKEILVKLAQELDEMRKAHKNAMSAVQAIRRAMANADKSEKEALRKKIPKLNRGSSALVQEVFDSLLQDPDLWIEDKEELEVLYKSAGKEARDAYDKIRETLIRFGVAEDSNDVLPRLMPVRESGGHPKDRLTHYEKLMVENLNAIILSQIVLPGIVGSERRKNYVDDRVASIKEWRDVYRYAPDGTLMGWQRYQSDGVREFNAEGLLVLDRDSLGRCIRAKVVRYELESQNKNPQSASAGSFRKKVKMIPTDTLREYEYRGADDWRGNIKLW